MLVSWSELEAREPELAASSRRLLYPIGPEGPGLGFLATTRADGGPRVHPVCPTEKDDQSFYCIGGARALTDPAECEAAKAAFTHRVRSENTVWLNPRQPGTKPVYHRWQP